MVSPASFVSTRSSNQASPGMCISARSLSNSPGMHSSTRQKSTISPASNLLGSRRPLRIPGPPKNRSISPRVSQASGKEYQPFSPPIPSMIRHSDSGVEFEGTYRSSVYSEPPAQSGSVGNGSLGSPGIEAEDQRDFTFA